MCTEWFPWRQAKEWALNILALVPQTAEFLICEPDGFHVFFEFEEPLQDKIYGPSSILLRGMRYNVVFLPLRGISFMEHG